MESNNLELIINNDGNDYYAKWEKDSRLSLFVAGPVSLIVISACFIMIAGFTLKFILIMIWPLIMIGLAFFYGPFITKGRLFTHTIKRITVNEKNVSFETYNWFSYNSVAVSARVNDIEIKVWAYQEFFKEKKVFLIILKNSEANTFYLVEDFFDNIDDFLKLFVHPDL